MKLYVVNCMFLKINIFKRNERAKGRKNGGEAGKY